MQLAFNMLCIVCLYELVQNEPQLDPRRGVKINRFVEMRNIIDI